MLLRRRKDKVEIKNKKVSSGENADNEVITKLIIEKDPTKGAGVEDVKATNEVASKELSKEKKKVAKETKATK